MVITTQRTIYFTDVQLHAAMGKKYKPQINTTLNERFGVLLEATIPDAPLPTIGFYAIGIGGDGVINGNNGYVYSKHSPIDAALFTHIPFLMLPVTSDLNSVDRLEYRMRTIEVFDGISYACYYLKKIPEYDLRDYFYKITTVDGRDELSVFSTATDKLLNPVPVERSVDVLDIHSSTYVAKLAKLTFSLTNTEIANISAALNIRGIPDTVIKEIGLCQGVDIVDTDTALELVSAQIAVHIEVDLNLATHIMNDSSIKRAIELGGSEPLLV